MSTYGQQRGAATRKTVQLAREPVLEKLVIPDLIAMADAGKRVDRNVLLWMQDAWVQQAMVENMPLLIDLMRKGREDGSSPEEQHRDRIQLLAKLAKETYSSEKSLGRGADLKTYLEAATTFFEAESTRYAGHLKDISEEIAKAIANGERPDVDRIARSIYGSTSKILGAMDSLEHLNKASADAVKRSMEQGMERIGMIAATSGPLEVNRVLFQAMDQISKEPQRYVLFTDPQRIQMPDYQLWDFEPEHRAHSL
jgi:hypothetical protein